MDFASDPNYQVITVSPGEDSHSYKETKRDLSNTPQALTDEQIEAKIENIATCMKTISLDKGYTDKPPFISQIYGQLRKKYYVELRECFEGLPFDKQNKYKLLFYKSVDIGCQKDFEELFSIRKKYQEHIQSKEFKASAWNLHNSLNLACISNSDLDLIRAEVMELSLDWYVAIDRAVDALMRCHLYGICKEFSYKDLYAKIKAKHCFEKPQTWGEWFFSFWRSSLKSLQEYFKFKATEREVEETDASLEDLLEYIACVACEQILSVYKSEANHEEQKQSLQKVKDFLTKSVQELGLLIQSLCLQIEECLRATTKLALDLETKEIEALVNCLFEFEKEEILRNSVHKLKKETLINYKALNGIELVDSVFIRDDQGK